MEEYQRVWCSEQVNEMDIVCFFCQDGVECSSAGAWFVFYV